LFFFLCVATERIWWTFFYLRKKVAGNIKAYWTSTALIILHIVVGVGTAFEYFLMQRILISTVTSLGLLMFAISIVLRHWSAKTLGRYHSVHIEIRDDQPLIKDGPYRLVRHPWYLAIAFEVCGFPLVVNAYYTFLFAFFIYIPILFIRAVVEEKEMIKKFGKKYIDYKKEVRAFIPIKRIFCNM
jgi:protein-S-isoprenylcysteine O-methyltransferase Ste14